MSEKSESVWKSFVEFFHGFHAIVGGIGVLAAGALAIMGELSHLSLIDDHVNPPVLKPWFRWTLGLETFLFLFLLYLTYANHRKLSKAAEVNKERDIAAKERDSAIAVKTSAIVERESAIAEKDSAIVERDSAIAAKASAIIERDSAMAEIGSLRKAFDGTRLAGERIVSQIYPFEEKPPVIFAKASYRYWVHQNGDTEVVGEYHIRADSKPVHFYRVNLGAEKEATPINHLDQINFKAISNADFEVGYLEFKGDHHKKRLSIYFLPQIDRGESEPRMLRFSYQWPGMMNKLIQGSETVEWKVESLHPVVGEVLLEFFYEPSLGKINCYRRHALIGNVTPVEIRDDKDWSGWQYKLANAPTGFDYKIEFARKRT